MTIHTIKILQKAACLTGTLWMLAACAIKNDIPYPLVEGNIVSMEVEGQCDAAGNSSTQATINKNNRTVALYIDDSANLSNLRITKLSVSNQAEIIADEAVCHNFSKFPTQGFESLESIPISSDTRMDFSQPVHFTLRTYQDYEWQVTVKQVLQRSIMLENQIGEAVIDDVNHRVVIYVAQSQPLNRIQVSSFDLGGKRGKVVPDPTETEYYDFSDPCQFFVQYAWEEVSYQWTVYVYHSDENTVAPPTAFARTREVTVSGNIQNGKSPVVEYKKQNAGDWNTVPASDVKVTGTSYQATIGNLTPATAYQCRTSVDGVASSVRSFQTTATTQLQGGDFDHWHQVEKLWNPWDASDVSYWDTGNRGATTVGDSNSVPTDDTCNGSGQAACLESKWIVLKFASGNIFTGTYKKTVGTNGVLGFGRPFTDFPTKLRVNYKCQVTDIDKVGDNELQWLKGRPDSCHIYIALTDWDEPYEIRTSTSNRQLFDKNSEHVIAYGELIKGEDVPAWTQHDITLQYRYHDRAPKYILVVASASKYGDYFTGGVGTKLWVDNFELIYD